VAADDEFLLFIDKKNQLEVVVRELSLETNFSSAEIDTEKELFEFAAHAHFPSHGLILKNGKDFFSDSVKGITRTEHLRRVFKDFALRYGKVFVETDMRALYNPSRMKVIQKAAKKMAQKLKSGCPQCHTPGFGIVDIKRGLPCSSCQWPTQSTLSHVYICQSCSYAQEKKFPNGKCYEDPMYCDVCNP
jgi:hypothetical protein